MNKTVSVIVEGKVQGVYFRQSTVQQALALNITGIVCNLPDGSVKIVATGADQPLEALLSWCRRGPSRAAVERVSVQQLPLQQFPDFRIVRP